MSNPRVALLTLSLLLPAAAAQAGVDPALAGSWKGEGVPIELSISPSGACSISGERGTCSGAGGNLSITGQDGEVSHYEYAIEDGLLLLSGGDMMLPIKLRRVGGAPAGLPKAHPERHAEARAEEDAPAAPAEGPGSAWSKDSWGLRLQIPAGWKGGEKDGVLLLGSDSEAGLMIVRFMRKTSREELIAGYRAGVNEQGVRLSPSSEAHDFKASGGVGLAGDLSGSAADGSALRARTVAVISRYGGAAVVIGLTTEQKFATLKGRVDAVAQSFSFSEPKGPKGAEVLAGRFEYIYVSKTGGYSRESRITLCADGRFNKGGEMAGSGAAGSAATAHGNGGTWSSEGDGETPQVVLHYGNGQSETLAYRVSHDPADRSAYGPGVVIGSTKYQRTGGGDCR